MHLKVSLNLQKQEVENQQYIQQQTLEYTEMGNITQPQFQQVVTYPQVPKVNYPHPTSTVTSEGGYEIILIRLQGPTSTVMSAEEPSGNIVISLQDQKYKMSDQDIIRLLSTESGPDTSGRDTIVFTQTGQTGQTVTPVQGQTEIELIDELPTEPPNKKHKPKQSSKTLEDSHQQKVIKCDEYKHQFTRKNDLKHHKIRGCVKGKKKNFRWGECDKQFANKQTLMEHIVRYHQNEKTYECPACEEKFWNSTAFTRHKNSKHPGETFAKKDWNEIMDD